MRNECLRLLVAEDDERHAAARRGLRESEEKSRTLTQAVEQSATGIFITDAEGRIEYANPAVLQITGYSLEEILGQTPRVFQSGLVPPERYEEMWATIASGHAWRGEFHNRRKSGELFWARNVISPILDPKGRVTNFLCVQEDITERRKNERLAAVGMTASSLAHHIKNVLNNMTGSARLLDMGLQEGDAQMVAGAWPILKRSTARISDLVRDMLALARGHEPRRRPANLNDLIREILEDCRHRIGESRVDVRCELDAELPEIQLDPVGIHDAILNILCNAVDAINSVRTEGGEVRVATALDAERDLITLRISDNGPGITPDVQAHIFEPFFSTKGNRGTGLGLAVVKKLIEEHEGTVRVESEIGQSTTFVIELPFPASE